MKSDVLKKAIDELTEEAETRQLCKRKSVVAFGARIREKGWVFCSSVFTNGPARGHECSNVVGGCGCGHAEPRLCMDLVAKRVPGKSVVLVCKYSPCTNCANIIVDSGVFCGCIYDVLTEHDQRGLVILKNQMPVVPLSSLLAAERRISLGEMSVQHPIEDLETLNDTLTKWESACSVTK